MYTTNRARLTTGLHPFIAIWGRQDINGSFKFKPYFLRDDSQWMAGAESNKV